MAKSRRPRREESSRPAARNSRTTVSGPAEAGSAEAAVDTLAGKLVGTDELSVSLPFNPLKASEYEPQVLEGPEQGPSVSPHDPIVGASTVTERNNSDKVGSGGAIVGVNKTISSLDRVRVDSSKRALTTNQGVPVADNQHSLIWSRISEQLRAAIIERHLKSGEFAGTTRHVGRDVRHFGSDRFEEEQNNAEQDPISWQFHGT